MHTLGDGPSLLELLREAGDEAVTLDELEVAGVVDPARALLELELAGQRVQRVYEHESRAVCVRLAPEGAPEIDILGNELVEPPEFGIAAAALPAPSPVAAVVAEPAAPRAIAEPAPAPPAAPRVIAEPAVSARAPRGPVMAIVAGLVVLRIASRR